MTDGSGVSVVITTIGNTTFLMKSLESVVKQTYDNIQIIVVLDGENAECSTFLNKWKADNEVELCFVKNETRLGGNESRNIGIQNAIYPWVALLDDDDEWLPDKIEKQMIAIENSKNAANSICFTSVQTTDRFQRKVTRPRTSYSGQEIGGYLFGTKLGRAYGFIQTSTILASRELFLKNPFTSGLPKHQDWDWVIRAVKLFNSEIIHVNLPLTVYNMNPAQSVGKVNRWRDSEKWLKSVETLISKQSRESFLLNVVIGGIAKDSNIKSEDKRELIKERIQTISLRSRFTVLYLRIKLLTLTIK